MRGIFKLECVFRSCVEPLRVLMPRLHLRTTKSDTQVEGQKHRTEASMIPLCRQVSEPLRQSTMEERDISCSSLACDLFKLSEMETIISFLHVFHFIWFRMV